MDDCTKEPFNFGVGYGLGFGPAGDETQAA